MRVGEPMTRIVYTIPSNVSALAARDEMRRHRVRHLVEADGVRVQPGAVGGQGGLVLPPDLAYGSRGQGPIPANATLVAPNLPQLFNWADAVATPGVTFNYYEIEIAHDFFTTTETSRDACL